MASQSENRAGGDPARAGSALTRAPSAEPGRTLRIVALVAVALGLAALTAGACVLSYEHIHRLAVEAGATPRLASIYPLIFDALLVLAGCSVLALRGAGLVSRVYAWLCMLVLLAGLAGGGAVHAAGIKFSRKLGAVVAAVIPWVLVLIGFGLLLALLRYARLRRQANRAYSLEQLAGPPPLKPPAAVMAEHPAVPAPRPAPAAAPVDAPASAPVDVPRDGSLSAPGDGPVDGSANAPGDRPVVARVHEPVSAPASPGGAPASAPAAPAGPAGGYTSGPAEGPVNAPGDAPVRNAALAALAVARSRAEPVTRPQPAVASPRPGQAQAGAGSQVANQAPDSGPAAASPGTASPGTASPGTASPAAVNPGTANPGTASPAASASPPADPDLGKPGPHKLPVRQAELRLRARHPQAVPAAGQPPSAAAGAGQPGSGAAGPFMPPVGIRQPAGHGRDVPAAQPQHATAGQERAVGAREPSAAASASPATEPSSASEPSKPSSASEPSKPSNASEPSSAGEPSNGPQAAAEPAPPAPASGSSTEASQAPAAPGSTMSAAPTGSPEEAEENEQDGTPGGVTFRRQRSSPTPPDAE